jgi:Spy/CpxP family protein refolding chaperone
MSEFLLVEKNMNKRIISVFTLAILVFLNSSDLLSQGMRRKMMGEGHMRGMGPGSHMGNGQCFGDRDHMKNDLKLTDEQIKIIGKINWKYRDKLILLKDNILPKKLELKKLLLKKKLDYTRIKNVLREIAGIEVEIRLLRIIQRSEIEKIFTPSQLKRLREERMHHHG